MFFLSKKRRDELIAELTALTMPRQRAEDMANFLDDVGVIDSCISQVIRRLGGCCHNLTNAALQHDENDIHKWRTLISAELLVLDAYLGEIGDRQLPKIMFAKTAEAALATNLVLDNCRGRLH